MADMRKTKHPGLTIVGGQPSGKRQKSDPVQVPVGLEKVLYVAAGDERFKQQLLTDRDAAIATSGVQLRPSELAMLNAVSNEALEMMIARIVPENPRRRKFMGLVAAAATSLVAVLVETSCGDTGSGPDIEVDGSSDDDNDDSDDTDTDTDLDTDTVDMDTDTDDNT